MSDHPNDPILIPDYLSEDNWNCILKTFVFSEVEDLAPFRSVAEESDRIERSCVEAGRPFRKIAVNARAWKRWIKEQDVFGHHGLIGAFCWCEFRKIAQKEEREDMIQGRGPWIM